MLKSFSRLVLKFLFKGGNILNYKIEEEPKMILTGYKTYCTGAPYGKEREKQEESLFMSTNGVITNITDDGYDYYCCYLLEEWERKNLYNREVTGVDFVKSLGIENITIPRTTYAVFETKEVKGPTCDFFDLLNLSVQVLTEWMPEMGFKLAKAPEISFCHHIP